MTPALVITGVGTVSPFGVGLNALATGMSEPPTGNTFGSPTTFDAKAYPGASVAEVRGFDAAAVLGDKGLRNNDRLTRLLLVAGRLALGHAGIKIDDRYAALGPDVVGVCASTAYGSLESIMELDRVAQLEDRRYLNPSRFPNTVINSALGYVSIWEDLRALNVTVTNGPPGPLDAVLCAHTFLASGRAKAIVVGGAEAMSEALYVAFDRLALLATATQRCAPGDEGSAGLRLGEAAALMVLEPYDDARLRNAAPLARILGYGTAFVPSSRPGRLVDPSDEALARAITNALAHAGITASEIDLVASGLNGCVPLDAVELRALSRTVPNVPIAVPKAVTGEALGASAAVAMAAAVGWFSGARVGCMLRGPAPERLRTVLVPALGFYGNASALVLRCPE